MKVVFFFIVHSMPKKYMVETLCGESCFRFEANDSSNLNKSYSISLRPRDEFSAFHDLV